MNEARDLIRKTLAEANRELELATIFVDRCEQELSQAKASLNFNKNRVIGLQRARDVLNEEIRRGGE